MTNNLNQNKLIHHHHHHLIPPSSSAAANNNNRTSSSAHRSTSAPITTARSNSTTQACAACRYQRRKCAPDCILAPYFPHDRQRQFQNAHKLFGVSSMTKIIRDLDPQQKDEAMRTIIYQSDVRAQDPVGGCYRIIRELQRQIEFSCAELEIVLHQLAICRAHAAQQNQQSQSQGPHHHQQDHHHHQILIDGGVDCDIHLVNNPTDDPHNLYDDPSTVLDLDVVGGGSNPPHHGLDLDLGHIPPQPHDQHNHDHEQYILGQTNLNDHDEGCDDDRVVPLQEINSWAVMNNSPPSSAVCLDVKPPQPLHAAAVDECEDFKPLMISDIQAGERHEFKFEFDEINEPSEEALFNEGNHKALTKEENVSFFTKEETVTYQQTNEDHDLKEKGVPNFWLTAMKTHEILAEEIPERDEEALKYLKDIKWNRVDDPKGFKLEFFFDTNPFFKNSVLTKVYHMIDDDEPILEKAIGTDIEWLPGKCLTQKILKKKPKKGSKNAKPITKTEQCESFFNFLAHQRCLRTRMILMKRW